MGAIKGCTYNVDFPLVLHNADSQEEGEAEFVFFEQRPTDVRVETKRHVFVDVFRPLGHVICKKNTKKYENCYAK